MCFGLEDEFQKCGRVVGRGFDQFQNHFLGIDSATLALQSKLFQGGFRMDAGAGIDIQEQPDGLGAGRKVVQVKLQQVPIQLRCLVVFFGLFEKRKRRDALIVLSDPDQCLVANQFSMGWAQDRLVNRTEIIVVDDLWSPGYFGSAIDAPWKSDYAAHGQEPL